MIVRLLTLSLTVMLLGLASCESCPKCWELPPDYDRGPQRHPGQ
jgi:hypothetical protein